jgi:N-acetylglucosamine-6-phosphate deacetylase
MTTVFVDASVILENEIRSDIGVVCRGERIEHVGPIPKRLPAQSKIVSLRGKYLAPGLIDIHVHGGRGADFMDGTADAVRLAAHTHLAHGVTSIFPTCTTGDFDQIMRMIDAVAAVKKQESQTDASIESELAEKLAVPMIEGVHLYGPYFAAEKAGCHTKRGCRPPTDEESRRFFKTGLIKIATCAAELPGAESFYKLARKNGCLITCGHSNASWTEMEKAYALGMRHVDHFWCAMSSIVSLRPRFGFPMQASMAEFVLAQPEMSTEVIADGCHLSGQLLQFAWQMKTAKRLCLVSDSNRAVDMPPGRYAFGDIADENWIVSDGSVGRGLDGGLASSVVALDEMIRNMKRLTQVPLHEIIRMASLTPAERTGIDDRVGSIAKGKLANFVVLSKRLAVEQVILRGQRVIGPCKLLTK